MNNMTNQVEAPILIPEKNLILSVIFFQVKILNQCVGCLNKSHQVP